MDRRTAPTGNVICWLIGGGSLVLSMTLALRILVMIAAFLHDSCAKTTLPSFARVSSLLLACAIGPRSVNLKEIDRRWGAYDFQCPCIVKIGRFHLLKERILRLDYVVRFSFS